MDFLNMLLGAGAGGGIGVGVFIGSTRAALRNIQKSLDRIEKNLETLNGTVDYQGERIAAVEARLEERKDA